MMNDETAARMPALPRIAGPCRLAVLPRGPRLSPVTLPVLIAVLWLNVLLPVPASAQVRIGDGTVFTLPGYIEGCGEGTTRAGAGLIEHGGDCAERAGPTSYEIRIGVGGTHFFSPEQRRAAALKRAGTPRGGPQPALLPRVLATQGKPLALQCVLTVGEDGGHEGTCVRDEPETTMEFIVQAPTAAGVWSLLDDIGRNSAYR